MSLVVESAPAPAPGSADAVGAAVAGCSGAWADAVQLVVRGRGSALELLSGMLEAPDVPLVQMLSDNPSTQERCWVYSRAREGCDTAGCPVGAATKAALEQWLLGRPEAVKACI